MLLPLPDIVGNNEWIEIPIPRRNLPILDRQAQANEMSRVDFISLLIDEGLARHRWDVEDDEEDNGMEPLLGD